MAVVYRCSAIISLDSVCFRFVYNYSNLVCHPSIIMTMVYTVPVVRLQLPYSVKCHQGTFGVKSENKVPMKSGYKPSAQSLICKQLVSWRPKQLGGVVWHIVCVCTYMYTLEGCGTEYFPAPIMSKSYISCDTKAKGNYYTHLS